MHRILFVAVVFIALMATADKRTWAQKGNNSKQDERNENERVAKANRAVADAKKDLASVNQELKSETASQVKANLTLQQLKKKLRESRENAEERLGAKVGIPDALSKVRQAGAALEQIADKVRDQVHTSPQWIQAEQLSEEAKKKKAALNDDVELAVDEIEAFLAELSKQIRRPLDIEDEAIAKDKGAIEATKALAEQQKRLDDKRRLLPKGEVDRDPSVVQVLNEIERQEKNIASIESKVRKVKMEAIKIQKRYADAVLSLQRAKAADAADPNRTRKNNGKPN